MRIRQRQTRSPRALGQVNDLEQIRRDMDRLLGMFSEDWSTPFGPGVFPALNVTQDGDRYYVRAELPGMDSKDIEINAVHNKLTLSGTRRVEHGDESTSYHRRERDSGTFSRSLVLPSEIDPARIEAKYSHGILTVSLPKSEADKPRQITVQTS